jgi:hypothetical protein
MQPVVLRRALLERSDLPPPVLTWVFGDCPVAQSKADEYRGEARCEELAQADARPFHSTTVLEIAEKWRTMAAFEEKFGASLY